MIRKLRWFSLGWIVTSMLILSALFTVGQRHRSLAAPALQSTEQMLVYGETVNGELSVDTPSVFYTFEGHLGDTVTITMITTGGDIDPFLVLNTNDRTPLAIDDNSGGDTNARLTFVLPATGSYVIQATHAGGLVPITGGTFSLNLTAVVDVSAPEGGSSGIATQAAESISDANRHLIGIEANATILSGSIDRQTPTRFYWFQAQADEQIVLTPDQFADFHPLLVLYDSRWNEIGRAAEGAGMRVNIDVAGLYFLAIALSDTGGLGGNFALNFEQGTPVAREGNYIDIRYGDVIQGTIDDALPAITYRFEGSSGDVINLSMTRVDGNLDSYLYLLDGNGQLLFEDNDSGASPGDAAIMYTLPTDGPYLVTATRLGQADGTSSGKFSLEIAANQPVSELSMPEDYAGLPVLAYGDTVRGEISDSNIMDVYVFQGNEGDQIVVDLVSLDADPATGLDPLLILLDDQRIPLAEHDDIVEGIERDSHLEFTLPRKAYYGIVATRFDQAQGVTTGSYELTLSGPSESTIAPLAVARVAPPIDRLNATPLVPATPLQATFDKVAHFYTFTAFAGSLVDISVTNDPGLDTLIVLADENLGELQSSLTGTLTNIIVPETGKYLLMVTPRFGPAEPLAGGYMLVINLVGETTDRSPDTEGVLVYGDVVNGIIDDNTTSQIYTFAGAEGQRVRISMEASPGSTLDSYLELQDEDGTVIEANDDIDPGVVRDSQIVADLPKNGTYVIIASRFVGPDTEPTEGAYQLRLELLDDFAVTGVNSSPVPLAYNQTQIGEIDDEQYLVFYVFDGSAGDVVTIEVKSLSGNLDAVLHLYQSSGNDWIEIANNDDSPTGGTYDPLLSNIVLPQAGKYLIAVNRYGLERERTFGTFSITLTQES